MNTSGWGCAYELALIEVIAYQHKLTHHLLEETTTSEGTSSVIATKYFGENKLEDNLGEGLDDKLEGNHDDDICRTIRRTIGGQA